MAIRKREYTKKSGKRCTRFYAVVYDPSAKTSRYSEGFDTKKEAEREEARLKAMYSSFSSGMTFEAMFESWQKACKADLSPRTFSEYCYSTRSALLPVFGTMQIGKITTDRINEWKAEAIKKWKPETVNKRINCLCSLFNHAVATGHLQKSPMAGVSRCRVEKTVQKTWSESEIRLFLASEAFKGSFYRVPILLAVTTGIRPSELCGLAEEDLLSDRIITHRGLANDGSTTDLKTSRSHRSILLPQALHDEIASYIQNKAETAAHDYLFVTKIGTPLRPDVLAREFKETVDLAIAEGKDLQKIRLYDLRHSVATNMYLAGEKSKVISELLGNSPQTMERHYAHVREVMHEDAITSYFQNIAIFSMDKVVDKKEKAFSLEKAISFDFPIAEGRARDGNRTRDLLLGKLGEICNILQEIRDLLEASERVSGRYGSEPDTRPSEEYQ